jgi:hypothetical protein
MTQQSYGADRAAAFRAAERGEWIEPEVAAKAEASKAGLRIPQCGDNASPRDLIEARHAARTLVNRITSRMMKDGREPSNPPRWISFPTWSTIAIGACPCKRPAARRA